MVTRLVNEEVRIEPTNLCNYSCVMCPRDKHTRPQSVMNMDLYISIIQQITELGAKKVVLTGYGEPFADPTLEFKIKIAKYHGLLTYVISNASLFHQPSRYDTSKTKIQCAIDNGLDELRLSFYGNTETKYSNTMVGGNFKNVLSNIELLKKHKGACEVSHYLLDFDGNETVESYPKIFKDVVDYYEIWKPHNFGNGRNFRELNTNKTTCGRPQSGPLQINWSGIVVPCCYDYNENIVLGDASKDTIIDILNGDAYNKLRQAHIDNDYSKYSYCDNCDQLLCNKHETSIVYSDNPAHKDMTNEDIVVRTNTNPKVRLV